MVSLGRRRPTDPGPLPIGGTAAAGVPQSKTPARAKQASLSFGATLATAACVAIGGSVAVAALECLAAAIAVLRRLHGEALPRQLLLGAFGKAALSHTLLWLGVLTALTLVYYSLVRRRSAGQHTPLAFLGAAFVLLSGLVVVPADLGLAGRATTGILATGLAGVVLGTGATYWILRWVHRRLGLTRIRRLLLLLATLCALVTLGSSVAFIRSPWFNAAGYRVQPPPDAKQSGSTRPHLLWIVLDTVRPDRTSVHTDALDTTPRLSAWSDGAVVFERAISNGIWTLPSHASMFTGLSVRAHGVDHGNLWLDESVSTVATVLRDNGYATGLFSNNPFVSRDTNLACGFDTCQVTFHLRHLGQFSLAHLCEKWGWASIVPWFDGDFGAALANELVDRWLERQAQSVQPLFVFVNYMECHLPYRVPKRYRRLYMDESQATRSYRLRRREYGDIIQALDYRFNIEGRGFFPPADRGILKRQYLATLRYLDDRVAELLDIFRHRGLLENTLVVIVSDHGEYLDTHGMWSHRFLAYNDVIHVVLMLREPARHLGQRVTTPVQLSDLYGTILHALLGQPQAAPGYDACDLFALAAAGPRARIVIAEYNGPYEGTRARIRRSNDPAVLHRARPQIAALDGQYKYIGSSGGVQELYDLVTDPGELENLMEAQPDRAMRLAAYIRGWCQAVPPRRPTAERDVPGLSPDVIRALRSLGYVGAD